MLLKPDNGDIIVNNQVVHPFTYMLDQNPILLRTKLHRPRLPHDLVMRPRLVDWLDQGLNHPLTLVCAAAGFGKTTLVSNWLEGMEVPAFCLAFAR